MAAVNTILDVQGLSKRFGARVLFSDLSFSIAEGQKVGLIARNGTGKSTLLSLLTGHEQPDSGQIVYRNGVRVGYLEQQPSYNPDDTVIDACSNHHGDETLIVKARQILTQLQITDLQQPMGQLSGGQRKRVALANVLIEEPDLLILDEPTNHLDMAMTEWLEGYLARATLTLLMVTHDRYFLDHVCSVILEIDDHTIYSYRGNYSYYLAKRQERIDTQRAEQARAANLYRKELEWMRRMPQARGHKARYREEAFYELQERAHRRIEERQMRLKATQVYIGSKIFEFDDVCKAFGSDHIILNHFSYRFARFEKMGIVGPNGTGKSTFIKLLLGLQQVDSGQIDVGQTVRFGYYSQDGLQFDEHQRVIDIITQRADYVDLGGGQRLSASQLLQRFLFTPEEQYDYVYKLSGGQRRKLYLCTVLMESPNFLVLDEPTNDLDIQTLQALEDYLQDFPGCVIVVSHDRYFMDRVVDHILVFAGQGAVTDFPGNYTQYRQYSALQSKEQAKAESTQREKKDYHNNTRRRLSYKEKRELEQLEKDIDALEKQQRQIEAELCSGTLSVEDLTEKSRLLPKLKAEADAKSERWLELSEIEG
ncbi:MAG: ABC-F family ATP-binding cassette domain-containing protein [Prevotella sp.]|nr:ABC-F family ATP-binding cassette domain-containing protein [Prevotella sp.]